MTLARQFVRFRTLFGSAQNRSKAVRGANFFPQYRILKDTRGQLQWGESGWSDQRTNGAAISSYQYGERRLMAL